MRSTERLSAGFLAEFVQLAALEFVAASVRVDNQRRLPHGQDEGRFAVTVAPFQCPAPGRKYIFVNSLESHGKVSNIRC